MEQPDDHSDDCWIFAYGSLIWRVDFEYLESRPASINHWARRFWQGSTDHRGIPDAPGRVVTLIEARGETCWGKAYRLNPNSRDQVLAHLDHREKGGYDYRTIVERGVPYPTKGTLDRLTVKATYDGQSQLGIAIFEIGEQYKKSRGQAMELVFDPSGAARLAPVTPDAEDRRTYFWMNEHNPTFLHAEPSATQGEARFEVEFNIDGNKRLLITARDLNTAQTMLRDYPVVKLT
jgi:hypothetical protein